MYDSEPVTVRYGTVFAVLQAGPNGIGWTDPYSSPSVDLYDVASRSAACKRVLGAALSYSILIVDDSEIIRHLLRSCLEANTDWQVCGEAENGQLAVERVEELHPDIVILDYQMPVMNGIEAAREITRLAPNTAMVLFKMN